ncbi:hypothetical protein [Burkholderia glumae]|nr:hypothetical protein [Burkholderia glumae]
MSTTHNERGAMEARLAEAVQEIAMLKQREQRARAALRGQFKNPAQLV